MQKGDVVQKYTYKFFAVERRYSRFTLVQYQKELQPPPTLSLLPPFPPPIQLSCVQ